MTLYCDHCGDHTDDHDLRITPLPHQQYRARSKCSECRKPKDHIVGQGFVDNLKASITNAYRKSEDLVKKGYRAVADKIIPLRDGLPPAVRKVLADYGERNIVSIVVGRLPVQAAVQKRIRFVSLGQVKQQMEKCTMTTFFMFILY